MPARYKKFLIALLLSAVILSLYGCKSSKDVAILLLLDTSNSTDVPEVRSLYLGFLESVLNSVDENGIIAGLRITDNAMSLVGYDWLVDLPKYSPFTTTKDLLKQNIDSFKQNFTNIAKKHSKYSGTDLLNTIYRAQKFFEEETNQQAKKKVLVIFSDMIEQSISADFTNDTTESEFAQIIAEARANGKIPNFAGIKVFIVGATQGNTKISMNKAIQIEHFWKNYFKETGADTVKYQVEFFKLD